MNLRTALIACLLGIVMMAHDPAQAWPRHGLAAHESSQDFVHTASIANRFEIESSRLAIDKSHNTDIKQFAQRMIDDHTKAGEQMQQTLQSSHSHAQAATNLDTQHQKLLRELQHASGVNFDRDYIKIQTDAHKKAVALFRNYSKEGEDSAIRQFAARTLPVLEDHLNMVEHLHSR